MVTLDHHTDILRAYNYYVFYTATKEGKESLRDKLIVNIDYKDNTTVVRALENLRNDEHIDCAIRSGIISKAFAIQYHENSDRPVSNDFEEFYRYSRTLKGMMERASGQLQLPERPFNYEAPEDNIYVVGSDEAEHNAAIESNNLDSKLSIINQMDNGLIKNKKLTKTYILYIDLDYFHTINSIHPKDTETFYRLIRNASIITIATEPLFIEQWKIDKDETNEAYNSEYLLNELIKHIRRALGQFDYAT